MEIKVDVDYVIQYRPHTRHDWVPVFSHPSAIIVHQEFKELGFNSEENHGKYRIVKVITLTEEVLSA